MNKTFKKQVLIGLIDGDTVKGYRVIENNIVGRGRWSVIYSMVFVCTEGKFWETGYSLGATEHQDEEPYEYDGEDIECVGVEPVEKTVIFYEEKA